MVGSRASIRVVELRVRVRAIITVSIRGSIRVQVKPLKLSR